MTLARTVVAAFALAALLCGAVAAQTPTNTPPPIESATGTYRGEVVSVLGLTNPRTGEVLGRTARLRIRNQPFDVRCLGGPEFGCQKLNRGAFVEVKAVLTPSTIEVVSVRVIRPAAQ